MKYKNIEEAIKLANGTDFGLSAVVVGNDEKEAIQVGKQLE
jgi:acyl-CoA reductase-like NAD-dependent aldehyde dehydrogenase